MAEAEEARSCGGRVREAKRGVGKSYRTLRWWFGHQAMSDSCDSMDSSPASVHETSQTRILEWAAIPFPGDLPDPGIKPGSPILQADSLQTEGKRPQGSLPGPLGSGFSSERSC